MWVGRWDAPEGVPSNGCRALGWGGSGTEVVSEWAETVELSGFESNKWPERGWGTKSCRTEEGAEEGQQGRGPRPLRGPTVGVHVERWEEKARKTEPRVPDSPGSVRLASPHSPPSDGCPLLPHHRSLYGGGSCWLSGGSIHGCFRRRVLWSKWWVSSPAPARGRVKGSELSLGPICCQSCQ